MNPTNDERARFEAWAQTQCASVSMYGNLYLEPNTQAAWLAWQAARSQSAPAAQGEAACDYWFVSDADLGDGPLQRGAPSSDDIAYAYGMGKSIVRLYATPQLSAPGAVPTAGDDELTAHRKSLVRAAIRLLQKNPEWDGKTFNPELAQTLRQLADSATAQPSADDAPPIVADAKPCELIGLSVVDYIANDGHRNANGGIYSTSVQRFAREIQIAFAQQNRLQIRGEPETVASAAPPADARDAEDARRVDGVAALVARPLPADEVAHLVRYMQIEFAQETNYRAAQWRVSYDGHTYSGQTLRAAIDRAMGGES